MSFFEDWWDRMTGNSNLNDRISKSLKTLPVEFRLPVYKIADAYALNISDIEFKLNHIIKEIKPAIDKYTENLNK